MRREEKSVVGEMEVSKLTLEIFSQLEKKWLMEWDHNHHHHHSPDTLRHKKNTNFNKIKVLSIDGGGGLKGLVSGEALVHLEQQLQTNTSNPHARIPDFFDLIAGTGMGGVLAAMITASDPTGRPIFSALQAVDFLRSNHRQLFRPAASFFGLRRRCWREFSSSSFERVLQDALRGPDGRTLTLKDTCKPLLIPCYDLHTAAPFVFSRADASGSPSFDFDLWRVCSATSATPGQFPPCKLSSVDSRTSCTAVDGGLVMNNPSVAALTHVLHNKRDFPSATAVEDLIVISIGNGPPARRPRSAGKCSSAAVMEIVLDAASGTVDQILANAFSWNPMDYVRIQASGFHTEKMDWGEEDLKKAGEVMLKERGLESLPFGGKRMLTESNGERIEALVRRLVAAAAELPPSPSKDGPAVRILENGC